MIDTNGYVLLGASCIIKEASPLAIDFPVYMLWKEDVFKFPTVLQ